MKRQVETFLPTKYGNFKMIIFSESENDIKPHFALCHISLDVTKPVAVRIHSECLTGDLLGSNRCDCGEQLNTSLKMINDKKGVLLYLRQEGRGIGLINKLKAYNIQDTGRNTMDANTDLGFEPDQRRYEVAIDMLNDLGVNQVDLITNNPTKIKAIVDSNITMVSRIPLIIPSTAENEEYLQVKKELMGHLLN